MSLIFIPYLVYKLYPPEITHTPKAKEIAHQQLQLMGKFSKFEWLTLAVFALLIFLWAFGEYWFNMESTAVALLGVSLLLLTGVLTWTDIKQEHEAWDTLIWFATLIMMASYLNQFGLIKWLSAHMNVLLEDMYWWSAWLLLTTIYFYAHYLFASNTAHVTSLYAAFLHVGINLAIPPYLIALSLAYCSSLFACITHYGTGCAPILFGSEYVSLKIWWRMGAFVSVIFLCLWVGLGSFWWKILGFW
jgi:DASS family divalent anion:Na+ symporter